MKSCLFLFIATIATQHAAAQNIMWSPPIPVSNGSNGFTRPHVTMCNDVPVVVWGHELQNKIYASRFVDGAFTSPVDVSPNLPAFEAGWMAHEITAAGDSLFVVFSDANLEHIFMVRSLDGGLTFGDTVRVDHTSGYPVEPSVDMLAGGNPVVTYIHSDGSSDPPRNMVSRSIDGGLSFLPAVDATDFVPGQSCDCCKATLTAKGNHAVILFRNNDDNIRDIWSAISNDNAASFNTSVRLDYSNWNIQNCPTSPPDGYIYNDTLVAVFMNGASGDSRVYMSVVDLNAPQQPQQEWIHQAVDVNQNYPRLSGHDQTMGVVWQQAAMGVIQTMFASSFNGPNGLLDTAHTLASTLGGSHTNPDVALGNGTFHVVFENDMDERVYYMAGVFAVGTPTLETETDLFAVFQSEDACTLRFNGRCDAPVVRLFSANGQLVQTLSPGAVALGDLVRLDTGLLSNGVYLVQVVGSDAVYSRRIVVR